MRRLRSAYALTGMVVLCAACWWRLGSGSGAVTFTWEVQGNSAAQTYGYFSYGCLASGVAQVQAAIGGQSATFDCDDFLDGGTSGTLDGIAAGTQPFTLTGFGSIYDPDAGLAMLQPIFSATGILDVAEDSSNDTPPIPLNPIGGFENTGDIELLWTFGGKSCGEAGNPEVTLDVDSGEAYATVPCHADGIDGIRITGVTASLSIPLLATLDGGVDYSADPNAFDDGVTETVLHVDLSSLSNGTATDSSTLTFDFSFGADGGGCAASGVDQVRVRLGYYTYPDGLVFDQTVPCVDPPALAIAGSDAGFVYCGSAACPLQVGEYLVYAQGLSRGSVIFELSGYPVWLDEGPMDADLRDAGVVSTYAINLPPVGAP